MINFKSILYCPHSSECHLSQFVLNNRIILKGWDHFRHNLYVKWEQMLRAVYSMKNKIKSGKGYCSIEATDNFIGDLQWKKISAMTSDYLYIVYFNCYYSLHFFGVHNFSIDLNNRDLLTTIIFFTQDWLNIFWITFAWSVLPFISQLNSLMIALGAECLCLPRNIYKCKQVACSVVVACLQLNPLFFCTDVVVACLLLYALFYTDAVDYFYFWSICLSF